MKRLDATAYATRDLTNELGVVNAWRLWSTPSDKLFVSLYGGSDAGIVAHYADGQWTRHTASTSLLRAFWGFADNDVWAIGSSGIPTHWEGASWTPSPVTNTNAMFAMYASGVTDLWAGGDAGTVLHYNGGWSSRNLPTATQRIIHLSGSGPNDVWALTFQGDVYRWTGAWAKITMPTGFVPQTLQVIGLDNVIALNSQTRTAQYWNGTMWTSGDLPITTGFYQELAATGPGDIFAMTAASTLFQYIDNRWAQVRLLDVPLPSDVVDFAVHPTRIDILYGGGELHTLMRLAPW